MNKLIITPKTKIYDLLEVYPRLEDILIASAPQFRKLKNPVLRNTIAKITNLGQAATIGGLNVEELVNALRKEIGQDSIDSYDETKNKYNTNCPPWYKPEFIVHSVDIREILHAGEQPVHEVLSRVKKLRENEILEVIAPFIPVPLIDKTVSMGFHHWLNKTSAGEFRVYLKK